MRQIRTKTLRWSIKLPNKRRQECKEETISIIIILLTRLSWWEEVLEFKTIWAARPLKWSQARTLTLMLLGCSTLRSQGLLRKKTTSKLLFKCMEECIRLHMEELGCTITQSRRVQLNQSLSTSLTFSLTTSVKALIQLLTQSYRRTEPKIKCFNESVEEESTQWELLVQLQVAFCK